MNPLADNSEFEIDCKYTNSGGYQLKKCSFQCKNGNKIQPMNKKKMTNVMCKCRIKEFDNQCHWAKGSSQYDLGDEGNDFGNLFRNRLNNEIQQSKINILLVSYTLLSPNI